eukprot:scaffold6776_cov124-Cylindrotheca_fusiformis.AAC.1
MDKRVAAGQQIKCHQRCYSFYNRSESFNLDLGFFEFGLSVIPPRGKAENAKDSLIPRRVLAMIRSTRKSQLRSVTHSAPDFLRD